MTTFLKKLDRIAQNLVNTLDQQVHEPIMRSFTGEVFTHGTTSTHHTRSVQQPETGVSSTYATGTTRSELPEQRYYTEDTETYLTPRRSASQ